MPRSAGKRLRSRSRAGARRAELRVRPVHQGERSVSDHAVRVRQGRLPLMVCR